MKAFAAVIVLALTTGGSPQAVRTPATPCEHRGPLVAVAATRAVAHADAHATRPVAQAEARQAGLIVETPSATSRFCIGFTAEEEAAGFTGIDLLERAGVGLVLGGTRDLASVCRIDDVGCDDAGDCFCQCRDANAETCAFWGYYTLNPNGTWSFAQSSASLRLVRDGDVDGWRFGNHAGGAGRPPAVPDQRCVNASLPQAASPGDDEPAGSGGFPVGLLVAAVIVLGFAAGIAYGLRVKPEDPS